MLALENGDRTCVIRGAPANVTHAESLIEKYIIEQPVIYTETLTVPLSSVGRIIGRGGETIRAIQDQSKARVNVESHNHYGRNNFNMIFKILMKTIFVFYFFEHYTHFLVIISCYFRNW